MENFLTVASQVAVLFALMAVGVVVRRVRFLSEAAIGGMTDFLITVVTPCVIVNAFQRPFDPSALRSVGEAFAISVTVHLIAIALAYACVWHPADDTTRVLRLATVFSNAGFMGIPLLQAILGEPGVFYGSVYIVLFNIFIWTWGLAIVRRTRAGERLPWRTMLLNPGIVGLAAALPIFLLSIRLPPVLREPIRHLSELNTPLAMIVIGYHLGGARLVPALRLHAAWVAAYLRLVGCPMILILALQPFRAHFDRTMMLALVTVSAAPTAAMVSMFATRYKRDVDVSVALVSGTTLLCLVTLPAVIAIAMDLLN